MADTQVGSIVFGPAKERRVSPAIGEYAIQENAKLRAANAELVEMLQRAHNYIETVQGPNEGGIQREIRIAIAKGAV